MELSYPLVYVILVNWNGANDTIECIASLQNLQYPRYRILIVDNCSSDTSVDIIRSSYEDVEIIQLKENTGFAGGNNIGIRHAFANSAKYAWLLNNDTTVTADSLSHLVTLAESHPDHNFFGSWISFYSDKTRLWFGGGSYNWFMGAIGSPLFKREISTLPENTDVTEVSWITGCSLLVSDQTISRCGYMDESFFLYREELEWQLRAAPRSPSALMINRPLVFHKVGVSTGSSNSVLGTIFMSRNLLKIALKYKCLTLTWFLRWSFEFLIKPALQRRPHIIKAALKSVLLLGTPGGKIVEMYRR